MMTCTETLEYVLAHQSTEWVGHRPPAATVLQELESAGLIVRNTNAWKESIDGELYDLFGDDAGYVLTTKALIMVAKDNTAMPAMRKLAAEQHIVDWAHEWALAEGF